MATWDIGSHELAVILKREIINRFKCAIAKVGHDTKRGKSN
jgi:hypothetical protein